MNKKIVFGIILLILLVSAAAALYFTSVDVAVLNPQGEIAEKQRSLIVFTVLLSLVVVLPVFFMLGLFAWKYRASNTKAQYRPDWDGNKFLETIWWGIPIIIIGILSVVTWQTSHDLDPTRAINSKQKPLEVQVVAMQWKWLFIYPEERIASVNLLEIPEDRPIHLTLTSDAPMNSFWVPSLGSQIYAMSGMSTKLNLIADKKGDFKGSSANISGKGFADMNFIARAVSKDEFEKWAVNINTTSEGLGELEAASLSQPGVEKKPKFYRLTDGQLYDKIVMKYMGSHTQKNEHEDMEHMNHEVLPSGSPTDMKGLL